MSILAIDPGPVFSAWVTLDAETRQPLQFSKEASEVVLRRLHDPLEKIDGIRLRDPYAEGIEMVAIEMVASYGMAVGAEVFETCVWIGRFAEVCTNMRVPYLGGNVEVQQITRKPIKLHHCRSAAAKDSNITQALIDRFAPGVPNRGKGHKASPGWFYGFRADIWQAYALGVYAADLRAGGKRA